MGKVTEVNSTLDFGGGNTVLYVEYLDSVNISIDEAGIIGTRKIRIAGEDIWKFIEGMGSIDQKIVDPARWNELYSKDTVFPTFPSKLGKSVEIPSGDYFGTELRISKFDFSPSYSGRQKNVVMEKGVKSSGPKAKIINYTSVDVVISYRQRPYSKFTNEFDNGTVSVPNIGELTWKPGTDPAVGATSHQLIKPAQEIKCFFRSQELNLKSDKYILNQYFLDLRLGTINFDEISLYFGRDKVTFKKGSLLFANYETENNFFLGQFGKDFMLTFKKAAWETWNYIWDSIMQSYQEVNEKLYPSGTFKPCFPVMWGVAT